MASRDSFSIDPQSDSQQEVITDLQHVGQALQRAREARGLTFTSWPTPFTWETNS